MTRAALLLSITAAACSFEPRLATDADTAGDDVDAPGMLDARDGDAPPPADTDGDTIDDAVDNCVTVSNVAQLNEDGDDRGNACDACPHLPGSVPGTDADTDGDGLGDQCDPGAGTDRLVVFLGFDSGDELAAFSSRAGSNMWTISGGQLHQTDASYNVSQQTVWTGESIVGTVIAETGIHVDSVPMPTMVGSRIAAVSGGYYDPGTPVDAYACGLRAVSATATTTAVAAWHYVDPPVVDGIQTAGFGGMIGAGMTAHVRLVATNTNPDSTLDCRADTATVNLPVPGYYPEGYPGFRTLGVTASFDYLFVVAPGA